MLVVHHQLKKLALMLFFSVIAVLKLVAVDQLSKWWMKSFLIYKPHYTIEVTSFFDLSYSWNHGISFGMFAEYYQHSNNIFLVINTIIILYLWRLLLRANSYRIYLGYSLIIGGAVGNLCDRLMSGAVFDFLAFHIREFYFPVFNIADIFIFLGVVMVLYQYYKESKAIAISKKPEYDAISAEAERIRRLDEEIAKKEIGQQ